MTDERSLARRLSLIEDDENEPTAEEWAEEYADRRRSEATWEIVASGEELDTSGVLITTDETDHYCAEYRADPEELPDHLGPEDFPV